MPVPEELVEALSEMLLESLTACTPESVHQALREYGRYQQVGAPREMRGHIAAGLVTALLESVEATEGPLMRYARISAAANIPQQRRREECCKQASHFTE